MTRSSYTDINSNIQYLHGKDVAPTAAMIQDCIRQVSAEIYRIIKLPYTTPQTKAQIMYLEELLAAYERDYQKFI